jgi:16S rRNA (adenine1518-N6/adenine1519-N6)-dimethyltransferase
VVKTTFNQRRKTIRNSIKPLIPDGDFSKKEDIDLLTKRPEQLSVEEFIRLTEWLAQ